MYCNKYNQLSLRGSAGAVAIFEDYEQDNKEIADLLAIAPRSVLMLRHRFRQKIGLTSDNSLENFIDDVLRDPDNSNETPVANSSLQTDNSSL